MRQVHSAQSMAVHYTGLLMRFDPSRVGVQVLLCWMQAEHAHQEMLLLTTSILVTEASLTITKHQH
jgi:hypothetical protein